MAQEKILIIDDNPMNLELVTDLLELQGFKVLQSEDARIGIDLVKKELPDLILMDLQLPGMDGLTATRLLKDDPTTRDIPVVALTAHAMKGDDEKVFNAGCIGYITKPINTREFPATIKNFLKK